LQWSLIPLSSLFEIGALLSSRLLAYSFAHTVVGTLYKAFNHVGTVCASPLAKMPIYMVGIYFQSYVQVVQLDFTKHLLQTSPTPSIFKHDLTSVSIQSQRTDGPGRASLKNTCEGVIHKSYKQAVVTGWTEDLNWTAYLVCHHISYGFPWLTRLRDPWGTGYSFPPLCSPPRSSATTRIPTSHGVSLVKICLHSGRSTRDVLLLG
jgi:hypothetical protein